MFRNLPVRVILTCRIQNWIQAFIIKNTFWVNRNKIINELIISLIWLTPLVNTNNFVKLLTLIYQFMSLVISKPNLVCTSIEMFLNVKLNVEIVDRYEYFW